MSASTEAEPESFTGRFEAYDPMCPHRLVVEHVTSRWGVLLLDVLHGRTYRFSELRRLLDGVSEKVLAQTLRTLERDGLVLRRAYPQVPPRVEYSLTAHGDEAAELVGGLLSWVDQRMPHFLEAQRQHDGQDGAASPA